MSKPCAKDDKCEDFKCPFSHSHVVQKVFSGPGAFVYADSNIVLYAINSYDIHNKPTVATIAGLKRLGVKIVITVANIREVFKAFVADTFIRGITLTDIRAFFDEIKKIFTLAPIKDTGDLFMNLIEIFLKDDNRIDPNSGAIKPLDVYEINKINDVYIVSVLLPLNIQHLLTYNAKDFIWAAGKVRLWKPFFL